MKTDKRKVALVGCGMVGMSYAYAMLNQNVCDELVLIDVDKKRAEGEAMDMNHGLAFSGSNMKIFAGSYDDCGDADIVCICAGVAQKPGETRLDLLQRNAAVFKSIIDPVTESGFNGLFLVATNPVDIMTRITCALSGFNPRRVLGTGTALDTARLRYLLGDYFHVDPRNMHAYVMGEHGDSEFVPWSQAMLATKPVLELCRQSGGRYCSEELDKIAEEVRTAAYKIIEAKRATYYGIGMALTRITRAVFGNESSVLTVSAMLRGEYGQKDVFVGVPCIVNRSGIQRVLELNLSEEEQARQGNYEYNTLKSANARIKELESQLASEEKKKKQTALCRLLLFWPGRVKAPRPPARAAQKRPTAPARFLRLAQRSGNGPLRPYDTMSACCRAVTNEHPVKK